MSKRAYKISYYVLYALFAVIAVVFALFYFGGQMEIPVAPGMSNPAYTETLLFLIYGLLVLTVVITLIAFIIQFAGALKDNPVNALKSLIGIILLAVLLIITWSAGSDEPLVLVGYEGKDNVPFWLKMADMFLYSLYSLVGISIVAMIFSGVKKRLS